MGSSRFSITFFGPIDGFDSLTLPAGEEFDGRQVPHVSSSFDFNDTGRVMSVRRLRDKSAGGLLTWVTFYRQVYEKDLNRRGHCLGVGFCFSAEYPGDLSALVHLLLQLLKVMETKCVSDGKFCDRATFQSFVKDYIGSRLDALVSAQFKEWRKFDFKSGLRCGLEKTIFTQIDSMDDESALVSIAGWCLSGPGATLASELIVSDKESGSPSEGGGYINNFAALDKSAYDQAIQKVDELARDREGLEAELGKLGSKVKEEAGRAAQLESELVRLKADYASRMQPRSPFSAQPRAPSLSRFADSRQRPVSSFSGLERTGGVNGRGDEFKESGRSVYSVDSVELFSLRPIVDRLDESLDSIAKTEVRASKILKSTLLISYTSAAVLFLSLVVSFFFFFRTEGERPPAAEETAIPPEVRAPSMPRPSSIRIDNDRPSTDNFGSRESENKR